MIYQKSIIFFSFWQKPLPKFFSIEHIFLFNCYNNFISNSANLDSAAEYVKNAGILPNLNVAKSAITNLGSSIAYVDGSDMKAMLVAFYKEIGITAPEDFFYYEK